ncbi:hypothetical protein MNBD_BACTEROID07-1268, partial [hydrothermal vent metagenome]
MISKLNTQDNDYKNPPLHPLQGGESNNTHIINKLLNYKHMKRNLPF